MNMLKSILVYLVLVVTAFALGFVNGCQTAVGICGDVKWTAGAAEEVLTPLAEKERASDRTRTLRMEQRRIDGAKYTLEEYNNKISQIQAAKVPQVSENNQ